MRHPDYDYTQAGGYFITLLTDHRRPYFGNLIDGDFTASPMGKIALDCWANIPVHFPQVVLDEYVLMPNHLHGILLIYQDIDSFLPSRSSDACVAATTGQEKDSSVERSEFERKPPSISTIIGSFKSAVTRSVHMELIGSPEKVWQRGFHDRIIRNEKELDMIRLYITSNPYR